MHPQGVDLNLFGSVRPERREGQRSKGKVCLVASSRRFVFVSSRRFVSSFRFRFVSSLRLVVSSRRFAFVSSFRFRLVVSFRLVSLSFRQEGGKEEGRKEGGGTN